MEEDMRVCLRGIRVWVGSVKTSFGIGSRPCSKGSRRGWSREIGFGFKFGSPAEDDGDIDVSMGSLMAWEEESLELQCCRSSRDEN